MRSHLEFRAASLVDEELANDEPAGETAARFLAATLPEHGFPVLDVFEEDWGWCVRIANETFPLWVGCGSYLDSSGHLWFIEPSRPYVRRWLRRISTTEVIERLASVLEEIVPSVPDGADLRWWTEAEISR
ncbi:MULTISPECIES: hypothetical protein [unclassified Sphingomonas]|uniref:hypothetical protein n=1 Tax=unclassified Sphingomonas TaxID=196159 RepID=UPI0012E36CC8|nr:MULTISPECIES: hypothetical protein [unclassified Sphingomonas]